MLVAAEGRGCAGRRLWRGPRDGLVGGEVALLLDRGYQKFHKDFQNLRVPCIGQPIAGGSFIQRGTEATDRQHISFYNESLGTTSDVYEYDRLQGRAAEEAAAVSPQGADHGELSFQERNPAERAMGSGR